MAHVWVRRSGTAVESALRFELPLDACVGDVVVAAAATLYPPPGAARPQDLELVLEGAPLSHDARVPPTRVLGPVLELRRRFKRRAAPESATRLAADSPSAAAALSPVVSDGSWGAAVVPPEVEAALSSCVFEAQWNSPQCATCGHPRRLHRRFPPSTAELQDRMLRHLHTASPVRARHADTPLWSPQAQVASPIRDTPVCAAFRSAWGKDNVCVRCGHAPGKHPQRAASPVKASPPVTPSRARRGPGPPRYRSPTASALRKTLPDDYLTAPEPRHAARELMSVVRWREAEGEPLGTVPAPACCDRACRKRVCGRFVPLWNHNDFCATCYCPRASHLATASSQDAPVATRLESGGGRRLFSPLSMRQTTLRRSRLRGVPWERVLPFCPVESLLVAAQVCRAVTALARPLLAQTMQCVLRYDVSAAKVTATACVGNVACASWPPESAVGGLLVQQCLALVGRDAAGLDVAALTTDVEALGLLVAAALEATVPVRLPEGFLQTVETLEQHTPAKDEASLAEAARPLIAYFRALCVKQRVQSCAARYLSAEKVKLA